MARKGSCAAQRRGCSMSLCIDEDEVIAVLLTDGCHQLCELDTLAVLGLRETFVANLIHRRLTARACRRSLLGCCQP